MRLYNLWIRVLGLAHKSLLDYIFNGVGMYKLLSPYLCFISFAYLDLYVHGDDASRRSGVTNSYLWFWHFSGKTKNWITFARSVLNCWKSDRIIFSNIHIHCYFTVIMKSLTWVTSFWPFFREKPSSNDILNILFHGKTSYLGKMSAEIMELRHANVDKQSKLLAGVHVTAHRGAV